MLRVCCNDAALIKIHVEKMHIYAAITRGKEISSKTCCERKIIRTKLTAVKLLTKQELRKKSDPSHKIYEHATTHKQKNWDNKYSEGVYKEKGKKTGS